MAACNTRRASVCHAVVAVFLQFFSWGLITAPMIHILNTTFKVIKISFIFRQNTKYKPESRQMTTNMTGNEWYTQLNVPCILLADLPSINYRLGQMQQLFGFILNSFQNQALLMNGVVMGVKGFLSFLSAPLIGALSDVFGRKMFLLITALFTCLPVPFLKVL